MSDEEFEAERREQMHRLRVWAGHQPVEAGANPVHVLRARLRGSPPGVRVFVMARWSLVARLVADAADAGMDQVEDLGPDALLLCQAANRGEWAPGTMVIIGVAKDSKWLQWNPPAPVEPVPGSPGATAARN